jgi:hypothetical protein
MPQSQKQAPAHHNPTHTLGLGWALHNCSMHVLQHLHGLLLLLLLLLLLPLPLLLLP